MKGMMLPIALLAAVVTAQTTSVCAADYILEACLGMENAKISGCAPTDYSCQCAGYTAVLTCFNNCPNDPRLGSAAGQKQIFCQYQSQFQSSTTNVVAAVTGSTSIARAPVTATTTAATTGTTVGTSSSTPSSTATAKSNSAADLVLSGGSALVAVAGAVVALF